jgi:hypothetical protein
VQALTKWCVESFALRRQSAINNPCTFAVAVP